MHENFSTKDNGHTLKSIHDTLGPPPSPSGGSPFPSFYPYSSPPELLMLPYHPYPIAPNLPRVLPSPLPTPIPQPIPKPSRWSIQPHFVYLTAFPAEHTTIPFIACLSDPFSELKDKSEGKKGRERKKYTKKQKKQLKTSCEPCNIAVSQPWGL